MFIPTAILLVFSLKAPCGGCSLIHPLLQPLSLQSFSFPKSLSHSHCPSSSFPAQCHQPCHLLLASMSLKQFCKVDCRFHVNAAFALIQFVKNCYLYPWLQTVKTFTSLVKLYGWSMHVKCNIATKKKLLIAFTFFLSPFSQEKRFVLRVKHVGKSSKT